MGRGSWIGRRLVGGVLVCVVGGITSSLKKLSPLFFSRLDSIASVRRAQKRRVWGFDNFEYGVRYGARPKNLVDAPST